MNGGPGAVRLVHRKKKAAHGTRQLLEAVLAHQARTVVQLRRQMQAFARNGQHHPAHLEQAAEKGQDRPEITLVVQIAPGQDQIAQAGKARVKIPGHALQKKTHVQAQGSGEDLRHGGPKRMLHRRQSPQSGAQGFSIPFFGQASGAEIEHVPGHHGAVGQGQQAVADIAHGGHGKSPAQSGGTAAGIKGGYQMDGIVGIAGQLAA